MNSKWIKKEMKEESLDGWTLFLRWLVVPEGPAEVEKQGIAVDRMDRRTDSRQGRVG